MSEGSGRAEVERRLIEKSLQDESFRRRLVEDPKGTVEQELGRRLPEGVRVEAVEETQDTIYLVLPSASMAGHEGEAVSDRELESVAGGDIWDGFSGQPYTCVLGGPCGEIID
ncbi:MAG TPA: NHLP leader peptide family RiPP precursor [Rubrobacter sp.]|nr:NHLP leader peptide family RiPP precursor [Rubrobacter sp.]